MDTLGPEKNDWSLLSSEEQNPCVFSEADQSEKEDGPGTQMVIILAPKTELTDPNDLAAAAPVKVESSPYSPNMSNVDTDDSEVHSSFNHFGIFSKSKEFNPPLLPE